MDRDNPVVHLCAQGMRAESEGRPADTRMLFFRAWEEQRSDHFDACVAAHYVARHQDMPTETLHWNQLSLEHANAVGDERVEGFSSSLYLNLGRSQAGLGDRQPGTELGARRSRRIGRID